MKVEMKLGYAKGTESGGVKFWPMYLCFIFFGIIIPFTKEEFKFTGLLLSLVLSVVIGFLTINVLIMIFNAGNAELRQRKSQFAQEAVAGGMLFMIPFAVLAALAQFVLGWNAVMPFASAAIMTACATAGAEVMKQGAAGAKNVMIPSGLAFVLSTGWMMLIGILP